MSEEKQETPMGGCLLHLFWVLMGPMLLLVFAVIIASQKSPPGGIPDILMATTVVAMIGARFLDRMKPEPPAGKTPASTRDEGDISPGRYTAITLLAAGVLYGLARFLGPRIL